MGLAERVTEFRREVIGIERAPTAPVLERHLRRHEESHASVQHVLQEISTGHVPPGAMSEAIKKHNEVVCEDMKVGQYIVLFRSARLPWFPVDFSFNA